MSTTPGNQPHRSTWSEGRSVVVISCIIALASAVLVFLVYLLFSKYLHTASYIPLIAGLVAVAIAPLRIQSNRRGLAHKATTIELAWAVTASAVVYIFALLFFVLNVLGS